ncbi:unnamed protein product [Arabidopsis lyrata]|uniref:Bulb-type lectin domain-containing protein n=1 Tax=Arabidopsis lyrata subsp. lyrata TaxID=81972 RepID=D7LPV9_ARALL|nr:hypothetical protein ARALYDRAFT_904391 [Arabidopsis lyrata subsp. lyrata]CAH8266452.1 unnamed protein product [Arabidopsis lyrata]
MEIRNAYSFLCSPSLPASFRQQRLLLATAPITIVSPRELFELGFFKLFSNNNFVLVDQAGTRVWGTKFPGVISSMLVVELLNDGNFIIKNTWDNDTAGFLWQSFDFPTDTLLRGMALGWNFHKGINRYLMA